MIEAADVEVVGLGCALDLIDARDLIFTCHGPEPEGTVGGHHKLHLPTILQDSSAILEDLSDGDGGH